MKHFKLIILACLTPTIHVFHASSLHLSKQSAKPIIAENTLQFEAQQKARQYAREQNLAKISTISDIEDSANAFIAQQPHGSFSTEWIEGLRHEIREFYLAAKMPSFIRQAAQACQKLNIKRTHMDDINTLTEKYIQQLHIPNDSAYQPIIRTIQEQCKKIIEEMPVRNPLSENEYSTIAITEARQYGANNIAQITTIPDIEASVEQFTRIKMADKSKNYSQQLIETLKQEVRAFYLAAKMQRFIRQAIEQCRLYTMQTPIANTDNVDHLTAKIKQQLNIPNDPAYQPIIDAIHEELTQTISQVSARTLFKEEEPTDTFQSKALQYAKSNVNHIKTIADVEKSIDLFAKIFITQQPQGILPPELIETLKHIIRKFYLDTKQSYFIALAQEYAKTIPKKNSDVNTLTQQFKTNVQIPSNPAYLFIINAFKEQLEILFDEEEEIAQNKIAESQKNIESLKNYAAATANVPEPINIWRQDQAKSQRKINQRREEVMKTLMQPTTSGQLPINQPKNTPQPKSNINEEAQKIINAFINQLYVNKTAGSGSNQIPTTLYELVSAMQQFNNVHPHININSFRDILKQHMLMQNKQKNTHHSERSLWKELFKNDIDIKLKHIEQGISLTTLNQKQLDDLITQTKQMVAHDAILFNMPTDLVTPMQNYVATFLQDYGINTLFKTVQKEYLDALQQLPQNIQSKLNLIIENLLREINITLDQFKTDTIKPKKLTLKLLNVIHLNIQFCTKTPATLLQLSKPSAAAAKSSN